MTATYMPALNDRVIYNGPGSLMNGQPAVVIGFLSSVGSLRDDAILRFINPTLPQNIAVFPAHLIRGSFVVGDRVIYRGPTAALYDSAGYVLEILTDDVVAVRIDTADGPHRFTACTHHLLWESEPRDGRLRALAAAAVIDEPEFLLATESLVRAGQILTEQCHGAAAAAGWWTDLKTGESLIGRRNIPEMLCLIHSEISEGMEGHRKNLQDDKLPHRKMLEVELADAVIRIFDLAGSQRYDLGGAIAEKMAYNASRADHKPEARRAAGGKTF